MILRLISIVLLALSVNGCASLKAFSQRMVSQQVDSKQIEDKSTKVNKAPITNDTRVLSACSYVIRDLSRPNASTIWCIPKEDVYQ